MRLPGDILAQIEGNARAQANRTLRQMRRVPWEIRHDVR